MTEKQAIAPAAASPIATHIILETDCGGWLAGKVLRNAPDVIAALEKGNGKYRPATPREIALAGVA